MGAIKLRRSRLSAWQPALLDHHREGGMLVGADARRFGDESLGYSGFARVVLEQGDFAFAIFDQKSRGRARRKKNSWSSSSTAASARPTRREGVAACWSWTGPRCAVRSTLSMRPPPVRRATPSVGNFGLGPCRGFYGCKVVPGLFHTQGGLKVDGEARVLRPDGTPIAGCSPVEVRPPVFPARRARSAMPREWAADRHRTRPARRLTAGARDRQDCGMTLSRRSEGVGAN